MSMGKKVAAFTVAGAIGVAAVALLLGSRSGETAKVAGANASADTVSSVAELDVPKVDYVIDLNTGVMTPLPEAIIRSVARSRGSITEPSL